MISLLLLPLLIYLFAAVLAQWLPLIAVIRCRGKNAPARNQSSPVPTTRFCVVIPAKNASKSVPWIIDCLKRQDYPQELIEAIFVLDRGTEDDATDETQALVTAAGFETFIRINPLIPTKSQALNDVFTQLLQKRPFDAVALFDVDARFDANYFRVAASYVEMGAQAIQGATRSKNPNQTIYTRIGDLVQSVIRIHQQGRSLLHLEPWLIGSHGIVLSRNCLEKMNWQICNGRHLGDDLELNLKRILLGIPAIYSEDLVVSNDLPASTQEIRQQRRRWVALTYEALAEFFAPMFLKGLRRWNVLESLFSLLLFPVFSSLFITLTFSSLLCWLLAFWNPGFFIAASVVTSLWLIDALYFLNAFHAAGVHLPWRDVIGLLRFLGVRVFSILEGFQIVGSRSAKRRWPTRHLGDDELIVKKVLGGSS